jgi:hypothetical protein
MPHFQRKSSASGSRKDETENYPIQQSYHEDDQVRNCSELKKELELVYVDKELSLTRDVIFKGYQEGNSGTQALLFDLKTSKTFPHYLTDLGLEPYTNGRWNNKRYLKVAPVIDVKSLEEYLN